MPVAGDSKVFRDPIHEFISVLPRALKAIDSEVFQRLRGISQLALTSLVYPGAVHNRFEHSLGAMHIARLMAHKAASDDEESVMMAGLLHDLGHGPFSHVLDDVIRPRFGRGLHESIGRAFITSARFIDCWDDEDQPKSVANLFDKPERFRSVASDIVSGPADADKCDYLLRDSHYCGVQYGRFDLARVIETAGAVGGTAQPQLGFEEGGVDAVEGLLYARRSMFRQVYRHPTRRATDLMLIRAMNDALGQGDVVVGRLIPEADGQGQPVLSDEFLDGYAALDDEVVRRRMESLEGSCGELASALRHRRLVHEVVQLDADRLKHHKGSPWIASLLQQADRDLLRRVEQSIAEDLSCDPLWVFVTVESDRNPLYRPPGWFEQPGDIIIEREGLDDERFQELSELWRPGSQPSLVYVSVFTHRDEQNMSPYREWDRRAWAQYLVNKLSAEMNL